MGTSGSKVIDPDLDDIPEGKLPTTPIQAPQIRRLEIDPRSPSSDIARTPIEVLKTPLVQAILNSTENTMNITEDLSTANEVGGPNGNLDPRSPTTEFHRTPIITDAVLKLQSMTLHNKNLDIARMPVFVVTPVKPKKIPEKVSRKFYGTPETDSMKITPPKLLESSPITVKPAKNKRNSLVGLLETNIDFVETDLDAVIQRNKSKVEELALCDMEAVEQSPIIAEEKVTEDNLDASNESINLAAEEDKSEGTTEINKVTAESEGDFENALDHDSAMEVPAINSEGLVGTSMEPDRIPDVVPDTQNMPSAEELDRKLTNLIYEDKQWESPKATKFVGNHRTPLGDRNSNSQQRRSIPTLKVSDKPTKPTAAISKIPVFKEKRIKGKGNVQCENTPPRMMTKRSQWSAEDSIII